ncbi:MAG: PLP-dependent aminotransferase family protein [Actinobacteria bacterium]|nr:PLP-dependent aminotransferase family protein [Actinomycetota bacterium]
MKELNFDKWRVLFSDRAAGMRASDIRDLLDVATRPDIISFAGGLPYLKLLDYDELELIVTDLISGNGCFSFQYGSTSGYLPLKKSIVEIMAAERMTVSENNIIITDGGQQALDLISKIFINPGDTVLMEVPGYTGALGAFISYQAKVIGIEMDKDGMRIDELESQIERSLKNGEKIKFIYTVPNYSNPSGITLSLERRKELLKLAKKFDILIVEDNPYGMLRFEGKPIDSLFRIDNENVIYVGSISKIFAPGLRVGWVAAHASIIEKLGHGKQSSDLCSSSLTQMIAHEYFSKTDWRANVTKLVKKYREHRNVMATTIDDLFPLESSRSVPSGGFYIWSTLPKYINTTDLLAEAINNNVAFVPGKAFYPDELGKNEMRLAFCTAEPDEIAEGIKRLANIIKDQMKLYSLLNPKDQK